MLVHLVKQRKRESHTSLDYLTDARHFLTLLCSNATVQRLTKRNAVHRTTFPNLTAYERPGDFWRRHLLQSSSQPGRKRKQQGSSQVPADPPGVVRQNFVVFAWEVWEINRLHGEQRTRLLPRRPDDRYVVFISLDEVVSPEEMDLHYAEVAIIPHLRKKGWRRRLTLTPRTLCDCG